MAALTKKHTKKIAQISSFILTLIAFFQCALIPLNVEAASPYVLNNGALRFGTGSQDSINGTGNLNQPFYYNSTGWRPLTFSNYPLDFEIMEGEDATAGTTWWNREGAAITNPSLTELKIDYSALTQDAVNSRGTGVIKTSGTVDINGKSLKISNTYTLPENKSFIKVTTRFENLGSSKMTNLRYWVGTRDDWIGNTDRPSKIKGNIVDGEFTKISTSDVKARALKIFTGSEGVLFYTDTDKANIIVGNGYGWYNVQNQNPATSNIESSGDQSYAFYVRLNDLDSNQSDEFTWYYAAGAIEQLTNIISDVANEVSASSSITNTGAQFTVSASSAATGYYVVLPQSDAAPSAAQIEAGQNAAGNSTGIKGSIQLAGGQSQPIDVTGLNPNTPYAFYFVTKDSNGNYSAVTRSNFTTTNRFSLTFDANGGSDVSPVTLNAGSTVTAPAIPTKLGYSFAGWNPTLPSIMPSEDQTFVAQWTPYDYTVTYHGEAGVPKDPGEYHIGDPVSILGQGGMMRDGYVFKGWNTESDFEGTTYSADDTINMGSESLHLYAVWLPEMIVDSDEINNGMIRSDEGLGDFTFTIELKPAEQNVEPDAIQPVIQNIYAQQLPGGTVQSLFDIKLMPPVGNPNLSHPDSIEVYLNVSDLVALGYQARLLKIYYFSDDGTSSAEIPSTPWQDPVTKKWYLVFTTTHFSFYAVSIPYPAIEEQSSPGKVELETVLLDLASGFRTTEMNRYLSIPEQWMSQTKSVLVWLDVKEAINNENASLLGPRKIMKTYTIDLMKRVTLNDGSSSDSKVDLTSIVHNINIKIPLSDVLKTYDDLGVAFVDETGSLAFLSVERTEENGQTYLSFENNRFSTYVLYSESGISRSKSNSLLSGTEQYPKTGENDQLLISVLLIVFGIAGLTSAKIFKKNKA